VAELALPKRGSKVNSATTANLKMNKKGFTLIELLIVISVISILVGITIPNFRGIRIQAKESAAKADLRNLLSAIEVYMNHHNHYPDNLGQLKEEGIAIRIINKLPTDPFKEGENYQYQVNGSGELATFLIFSVGPDGEPGLTLGDDGITVGPNGEDDIYVTNAKT